MDDVRVRHEVTSSEDWFDEVYRAHWTGMVRLAFVMVGDSAVAEELAQDSFLRVFGARARVEAPLPYLRSAIYNACRNHLRGEARRRRRDVAAAAGTEAPIGDHVIDAIHHLPAQQRLLVVLRYYEGLTDSEIAATVGRPIGSLKSGLHRALAELRKELG